MNSDPWQIEAARPKQAARRPELGPVSRFSLYGLGLFAALKGFGLVLVAGAVAAGIAGVQSGDLDTRTVVLLGAGGALLRGIATWATAVVAQRTAIAVKRSLRGRLWDRIAGGDAEAAEADEPPGDAELPTARARRAGAEREGSVSVLATDGLDDLDDYYTNALPSIIQAAIVPLILGVRILGADWLSALVIVLTVPLVPIFMTLIGKHTEQRTDEALSALTRFANHMTELARGLPVLVGLDRVAEQAEALDGIQQAYRARTRETLRWAFLSALALELISTISVAVVAVFLGLRLLNGTVGLEDALLALILAPECFQALREMGSAFHASQDGLSALERVRRILRGPRRADLRGAALPVVADMTAPLALPLTRGETVQTSPPAGFPTLDEIAAGTAWRDEPERAREREDPGPVAVRDLTVRYAGRGAPTLDRFSAEFTGITAVTGPSGSGKSTLLGALTGTLPADAEAVGWIVGVEADHVGWAPQAARSFMGTPWDELALYGAKSPEALLRELGLMKVAQATISELSPGELRRLAVGRALARVDQGATVLVLDEPTAHLDDRSAELVRTAIRRRAERATVILATHEPETLSLATTRIPVTGGAEPDDAPLPAGAASIRGDIPAEDALADEPSPITSSTVGVPIVTDRARLAELTDSTTLSLPSLRGPSHHALGRGGGGAWTTLGRLLSPAVGIWIGGILLAFATIAMGLSLTAVSGWLIVRASVEMYIMYLLVAIVGVRFFGIGRAVSRYLERLVTHEAAFRVTDALRLRLWRAIAGRGAGSRRLLEGGSPLDYLLTLSDELRDQLPRTIPPLAVGVLSIVGITAVTGFVVPGLTWLVLGVLLAAAAAGTAVAILAARGAARTRIRARSALVRGTSALASASDELRANGVAGPALARLDRAGGRLARAERRTAWSAGLASAIVTFATSLLAAIVAPVAQASAAELVCVVALLALAALEPLEGLVSGARRIPALTAVARRLTPLMDAPDPVLAGREEAPDPVREISLASVAASYPGRTEPVFRDVTGTVRTGEWLIVSGPSGSGKSTLLSVVMGALPAAEGSVLADDLRLPALTAESWRARIAWCPQDAYVFDSTIRGNLLLARPRDAAPSDDEMRDALQRAGLGPLLEALPDGLDTRVGSAGSSLSGGERQRLAVARALLTRADVILLDEPTAHLDAPTAEAMMRDIRLATADRIVILVSHRADTRELAGAASVVEL
ncbi:thiol reductant ABC exporter subunit CydC [Microbacterium sp. gxy059]|uniref:thiol reductant ABC exporter subunit CydC n=1 Tax=Microbacterium sp. gxy059 TaxID=2957199 RepID=UPI003D995BB6